MKKIDKTKFDKIVKKNNVLIADMRSPVNYRDGNIDNSVNLPLRNFTNKLMGLPRDYHVIAYSTSFDDSDMLQGMNYAQQLGFENLYIAEYNTLKGK